MFSRLFSTNRIAENLLKSQALIQRKVIGRIAVRKEFRGRRYGEKVLQGAEKAVRDLGGKVVELSAQCRVADFYNKQGYTGLNDIHMDEYCPHTWMRKNLQ